MSLHSTIFHLSISLIIIFGVLSNTLVCLVILLNKRMRTRMNNLLLNLAISGTVLLVFFGSTVLLNFTSDRLLTDTTRCVVFSGEDVGWAFKHLSTYLHTMITLEHAIAVKTPLKIKTNFLVRKQRLVVVTCWLLAISYQSIAVFLKYFYGCPAANKPTAVVQVRLYYWSCFFFNGALPMVAITAFCLISVHSLYFRKNVTPKLRQDKLLGRLRLRNAIKVVIYLGSSYIITGTAELVFYMLVADPKTSTFVVSIAFVIFVTMAMLGSSITPLASFFFLKRFRHFVKKLLCDCHGVNPEKDEKKDSFIKKKLLARKENR